MRNAYTSVVGPETKCSSLCIIFLRHILGKIGYDQKMIVLVSISGGGRAETCKNDLVSS